MALLTTASGTTGKETPAHLPPAFSVLLDLLRFLAALLVVVGHLTQSYFSRGWPNLTSLSFNMVAVFFVLSGFVIRYTVDRKPFAPADYFIHRLARIYSVLIPAVLFTLCADSLARFANPNFYNFHFYEASTQLWMRTGAVLFFVNEAYGHDITLMSNSPIWSLGYEVPYYLAFGIFFYLRGFWRWALLSVLAGILGPNIFVLFPLWLAGCGIYTLTQKKMPCARTGAWLLLLLAAEFVLLPLFPAINTQSLPENWQWLGSVWSGRSQQFPSFYVAGILTITGILAAYHLHDCYAHYLLKVRQPVKALASTSFSLYLYHFPCLVLLRALFAYDKTDTLSKLAVLLCVILACYGLAQITEKKKDAWVKFLSSVWHWLTHKAKR
ncbi:MAG TPA: acyltransferase [Pseudomonadales bacterium]|nr:acyltransferase [Pseudomonadales bacterium]